MEIVDISICLRESLPSTCNVPSPIYFSSSPRIKRKIGSMDLESSGEAASDNARLRSGPDLAQESNRLGGIKSWKEILEKFDIEHYRICVGLCSQALLWKAFRESQSLGLMRGNVEDSFHLAMWCFGLLALVTVSIIYVLKCVFYMEGVKREYSDRVGVNYFFAPWICSMLLMLGAPAGVIIHHAKTINPIGLLCVFMAPVMGLEFKIYGQWFSGRQRLLSRVANPSTHLSIVGNFVGAMSAATLGLKEAARFLFAVGLAHYIVLFVTLYQRLPTNLALPKDLHPVFFLFLAVPSTASLAWEAISGTFGPGSRMPYFLALFLFASMVVRLNFFSGSRFSMAWWAYAYPVTAVATASIRYSDQVHTPIVKIVAIIFSLISTATVALLLISTVIHTVVFVPSHRKINFSDISPPSKRRKFCNFTLSLN